MKNKIRLYVRDVMKSYRVCDKKLEEEIVSACYDEYEYQLSNGFTEDAAYRQCVADIEGIVKERAKTPKAKFAFALAVSAAAFLVAVAELFAGFSSEALSVYGFEMSAVSLGFIGVLIYAVVTRKKRYRFDFAVVGIFAAVWIASLLQIGPYAFHATMPDRYWSAEYKFPCVIGIDVYRTETIDPVHYLPAGHVTTYCFNFLVSLVSLLTTSILYARKNIGRRSKRETVAKDGGRKA